MQTEKCLVATFILIASCSLLFFKDFNKSRTLIFHPMETLSPVQIPLDTPLPEAEASPFQDWPLWVGVHFAGRLGNQMFQSSRQPRAMGLPGPDMHAAVFLTLRTVCYKRPLRCLNHLRSVHMNLSHRKRASTTRDS